MRSCKVNITDSFTTLPSILKEGKLRKCEFLYNRTCSYQNLINIGSILNLSISPILYESANLYFSCVRFFSYVGIFGWISTMHDCYFFDTISIKIRQGHWMIKVPGIAEKWRASFPNSFSFVKKKIIFFFFRKIKDLTNDMQMAGEYHLRLFNPKVPHYVKNY